LLWQCSISACIIRRPTHAALDKGRNSVKPSRIWQPKVICYRSQSNKHSKCFRFLRSAKQIH
jgi:hypothetical protein